MPNKKHLVRLIVLCGLFSGALQLAHAEPLTFKVPVKTTGIPSGHTIILTCEVSYLPGGAVLGVGNAQTISPQLLNTGHSEMITVTPNVDTSKLDFSKGWTCRLGDMHDANFLTASMDPGKPQVLKVSGKF